MGSREEASTLAELSTASLDWRANSFARALAMAPSSGGPRHHLQLLYRLRKMNHALQEPLGISRLLEHHWLQTGLGFRRSRAASLAAGDWCALQRYAAMIVHGRAQIAKDDNDACRSWPAPSLFWRQHRECGLQPEATWTSEGGLPPWKVIPTCGRSGGDNRRSETEEQGTPHRVPTAGQDAAGDMFDGGDGGDDGPPCWPLDAKVHGAPVMLCNHQHILEEDAGEVNAVSREAGSDKPCLHRPCAWDLCDGGDGGDDGPCALHCPLSRLDGSRSSPVRVPVSSPPPHACSPCPRLGLGPRPSALCLPDTPPPRGCGSRPLGYPCALCLCWAPNRPRATASCPPLSCRFHC